MCEEVGWTWESRHKVRIFKYVDKCITIKNKYTCAFKDYWKARGYTILTFQQLKEKLIGWKQGDVIVHSEGKKLILGVCGLAIFTSETNDFEYSSSFYYTQKELEKRGWRLKNRHFRNRTHY